jgi:hypothetical protein
MNTPTQTEREALMRILTAESQQAAEQSVGEAMKALMPSPLLSAPPQLPGLLMTELYLRMGLLTHAWCERAVAEAHEQARADHEVIPDRGLTRSEQRRRAAALQPIANEHLFAVCQHVAFRELTRHRQGVTA